MWRIVCLRHVAHGLSHQKYSSSSWRNCFLICGKTFTKRLKGNQATNIVIVNPLMIANCNIKTSKTYKELKIIVRLSKTNLFWNNGIYEYIYE